MAKVFNHDNTTTHLDYMSSLDIDVEAQFVRLSGIICTIGKVFDICLYFKIILQCIKYLLQDQLRLLWKHLRA